MGVQLFQKSGTILVFQIDSHNTTRKPIRLSIALQSDSLTNTPRARGFLFVEGPSGQSLDTEYHEIYAENNIISFKQQDIYQQATNTNETSIESISVSLSTTEANFACALNKDLRTIQQLYVTQSTGGQGYPFTITARKSDADPNTRGPFININDVAHIFYGKLADTSKTCE